MRLRAVSLRYFVLNASCSLGIAYMALLIHSLLLLLLIDCSVREIIVLAELTVVHFRLLWFDSRTAPSYSPPDHVLGANDSLILVVYPLNGCPSRAKLVWT